MSLKHHGITIDCTHCRFACADGPGSFDVEVPLGDARNHIEGTARLRCTLSAAADLVELKDWRSSSGRQIDAPYDTRQRLDAALDAIAMHRVCGNRDICPAEIVEIAEKQAR